MMSGTHGLLGLLPMSRSSIGYHYQGADYVVHLLAVPCPAFRPRETPANTQSGSAAAVFPLLARSYSPALLNSSFSADNRRWCSRNPAMNPIHTDSRDICR